MKLDALKEIPPWDWPEDTSRMLARTLRDRTAAEPDRLLAAELAGDSTVIGADLADALLSVLQDDAEPEQLRRRAAVSLGPVLELADIAGFEGDDEAPISKPTFRGIQESLHELYRDTNVPKEVRRRILEASVHAPQEWHREAIRAAHETRDEVWRLTAVFCMRFVAGFEAEILAALASGRSDVRYQAVCAAGAWSVDAAWQHVAALVASAETEKTLLLAAIDAVASIRPEEAAGILGDLLDSDDEDIVEAASEAISMAEGAADEDEEEE